MTAEVDVMQRELLAIYRQMAELAPELNEWNAKFQEARAMLEVRKLRLRLLNDRKSIIQTTLRSLTVF